MIKHFTVTAYLVTKINGQVKVLLHKHKKIGIWVGVGGHIEKDESPLEALRREVKEETNLDFTLPGYDKKIFKTKEVSHLPPPFIFQEEIIPQFKNTPAHQHLDFIYFGKVYDIKKIKIREDFGWFSEEELKSLDLLRDVSHSAKKALEITLS